MPDDITKARICVRNCLQGAGASRLQKTSVAAVDVRRYGRFATSLPEKLRPRKTPECRLHSGTHMARSLYVDRRERGLRGSSGTRNSSLDREASSSSAQHMANSTAMVSVRSG